MPEQQDVIIKKYFDLIASKTKAFKTFYYGDPIRIPASSMPALIGSRRSTRSKTFTNSEDKHDMQLVFTIVADVRGEIQDDKQMVAGNRLLYELMEGRDPSTYLLRPDSLLYILRHNVDIDPTHQIWGDIAASTSIDYGLVANKRANPSWSIEGTITTVASLVQIR